MLQEDNLTRLTYKIDVLLDREEVEKVRDKFTEDADQMYESALSVRNPVPNAISTPMWLAFALFFSNDFLRYM